MKCLEKKAADRWQTADELLPQLEALATPSGGVTPTGKMLAPAVRPAWKMWAMVSVVAAMVALLLGVFLRNTEPEGPPRLVVLPFENMGAAEDEYFADGITDEITSRLAGVSGLNVIARTSATQYKGSGKELSQIVDELNVDFLLTGTVQWSKSASGDNRVRVSPRFIRGSDETLIWDEPIQADLMDQWELQAEIAERVAAGMNVVLQSEERQAIAARPTDNLEAHDAYLRGLDYFERGFGQNWESTRLALELFDSAATLDPGFALAHVMRASARLNFLDYDMTVQPDSIPGRMARAQEALDEAMQLNPELVELQKTLGLYYWRLGDSAEAEAHYTAAMQLQPNDAWTLLELSRFQIGRGEWDSAEESLRRAGDLDPRSVSTANSILNGYRYMGNYEGALRYADRAVSLAADQPRPYANKAWLHVQVGDTSAARQALQLGAERVGLVELLTNMARSSGHTRMFRLFNEFGEAMRGLSRDAFGDNTHDYLIAKAYAYHANPDVARIYFDSIAVAATEMLEPRTGPYVFAEAPILNIRVHAYAAMGRREAAIQAADSVLQLIAGRRTLYIPWLLAEAYMMVGDFDAAVEQLRSALARRSALNSSVLRFDPIWDPMRDHPGFQELLAGGT
jgi:TolB-like protein